MRDDEVPHSLGADLETTQRRKDCVARSGARSGVHEESLGGATVAREHVLEEVSRPDQGFDAPGPIGDLDDAHATSVREYANSPRRPSLSERRRSSARTEACGAPAGSAR